jgi:hypothetical protein
LARNTKQSENNIERGFDVDRSNRLLSWLIIPLHEFSDAEKIYDIQAIQNLIWSIFSGMVLAIVIEFWKAPYN